jgi:DNA-binding PadR family transcriptional regulator
MPKIGEEREPLSEPVFLILTSLAEEPRHGYALMADIDALSNGRVRLRTGTLYGALSRLLEAGRIERFASDDTARDKRWYRLTPAGRALLAADVERLRQLTRAASARLRTKEV